jgi:ElaB/YqjD/DUF883 family membrane-anchored ribosome-binding protein
MDPEPHVIRQEINETRQSLTEKLETLENQAMGTVQKAHDTVQDTINTVKSSVTETVDTVKSTVAGTVDSVKRTFDIDHQVQERPFVCAGLTFAAGAIAGAIIKGARHHPVHTNGGFHASFAESQRSLSSISAHEPQPYNNLVPESAASFSSDHERKRDLNHGLFSPELEKVKELALGTVMGVVRDLAKDSLPSAYGPHIDEVMNSATIKLGGLPLADILHSR